jgi:glutamine cyclotransferase
MRILLLFVSIAILASCDEQASSRILYSTNMSDYEAQNLNWGMEVNLKIEGADYDSVHVLFNNEKVGLTFTPLKENSRLGINTLALTVYNKGEEKLHRESAILLVAKQAPTRLKYAVAHRHKHNGGHFTQGFYYEDGLIYEGTGLRGASKLEVYDLKTGEVKYTKKLEDRYFGEGITKWGDQIYQVTYTSQKAFVYDATSLEKVKEFNYHFTTEAWGLCNDDKYLIMSNGSHILYFINPQDFSLHHTLQVVDDKTTKDRLNELEYHNGRIFANVWYDNTILEIDAMTGAVVNEIVIPEVPAGMTRENVANGIAFKQNNILVTGKNWPFIYELAPIDSL